MARRQGIGRRTRRSRAWVSGFGEFIRRADSPYAGPNAQAQWAAYVMDKYVVGLVDAFRLSGVEEAKRLLPITIDKCRPYISPVSRDRIGKKDPPYDETYVSENLFHAAAITGDDKYRKLAIHYLPDKARQPVRAVRGDLEANGRCGRDRAGDRLPGQGLMRGAVMYVGLNPWDGLGDQPIDLPSALSPLAGSDQAYRAVVAGRVWSSCRTSRSTPRSTTPTSRPCDAAVGSGDSANERSESGDPPWRLHGFGALIFSDEC